MNNFGLTAVSAAVLLVAGYFAYRTPRIDLQPADYVPPDFGIDDTTPAPGDNWSGNVYAAADVAGIAVEGDNQLPTLLDSAATALDFSGAFMTTSTSPQNESANVRAFLDMIAFSEGTSGPDGYRFMFGYPMNPDRLMQSFVDHPRQYFDFYVAGKAYKTSASGRYQFLASTWDDLKAKLALPDFGPPSQDAAAIELIRQRGALPDVKAGRVATAIAKCAKTWASLPGAGYGQPERKLASLLNQYAAAGGATLEA
jgi:lysozyme